MATIIASQIPVGVPDSKINEFFSFCGKVKNISVLETGEKSKTIQVDFEKTSAVSTALLLNGAEFEGSQIEVKESPDNASAGTREINEKADNNIDTTTNTDSADIEQESKPKSTVVAELLANGYVLHSTLVQKAVDFDKQNGISDKFHNFISGLDNKYHLQEKNNQIVNDANTRLGQAYDQANTQWGLSNHWSKGVRTFNSYLDKFKNDKYGSQVHDFYKRTANDVKAVNDEALRLAELKKQSGGASAPQTSSETAAPADPPLYTSTPETNTAAVAPTINTITPESTTAAAASVVPLEKTKPEKN